MPVALTCAASGGAASHGSPPWAGEPLSPSAQAVLMQLCVWLLAHGLQAAGWKQGQSTHPAGSIWMVLGREVAELPSGSSRCSQANPNIWLCSDSYKTCLADARSYMMLLPDLSNGRCHLSFALQNLLLWLRQSWGKSLGIFDGTNILVVARTELIFFLRHHNLTDSLLHRQAQLWACCCLVGS